LSAVEGFRAGRAWRRKVWVEEAPEPGELGEKQRAKAWFILVVYIAIIPGRRDAGGSLDSRIFAKSAGRQNVRCDTKALW